MCGWVGPFGLLDWDHCQGRKVASISRMLSTYSWPKIELELTKCQLLCQICHRKKTCVEQKWNRDYTP